MLTHHSEGDGNAATSWHGSTVDDIAAAFGDAMRPCIPGVVVQHKQTAGWKQQRMRDGFSVNAASEGHYIRRAERKRRNRSSEVVFMVNMSGNALPRKVFVDDDLIGRPREDTLSGQALEKEVKRRWKHAKFAWAGSRSCVVVRVSILLYTTS